MLLETLTLFQTKISDVYLPYTDLNQIRTRTKKLLLLENIPISRIRFQGLYKTITNFIFHTRKGEIISKGVKTNIPFDAGNTYIAYIRR